jgi:NAD-dependent deacetylase
MQPVDHLAGLISAARRGVVFTGAGVSTESGIADFRSPGGIWSRHQPVMYDEFLASRQARVRYWKMRIELHRELANAEPNDGHRVIARLEQLGKIVAVVTQNIDGLHQAAGSRRVVELHGTARVVACVGCGKEWPPEEILARVLAGDDAPDCNQCGQPLKSRTISFGQAMPQAELSEAVRLSEQADLFLALGSSLVVEPAASLPALAKKSGATLVIINKSETPLDEWADLVMHEPIGRTMVAALAAGRGASN